MTIITDVRAAAMRGATPAGGWSIELKPDDDVHTIIAIHTDDGLIGLGSVFTNSRLVRASLEVLRPMLIGQSALEPERLSGALAANSFWMGRGGSLTHTISGIDIALWDLLGKASGQPVGRLLGGRYRERVRPYASLLIDDPEPLRDHLTELHEAGFRAFKIGWGKFGRVSREYDENTIIAAREAIGDDSMLAVDAGGSDAYFPGTLPWAKWAAEMLAGYGVAWFEEALAPDNLHDFQALRGYGALPISGGEVLTRRESFIPFLDARCWDIVQPDATKVGGLSESRRIGWMAEDRGIRLIPHGWNTAVGLAADLQLASALARTDLVEYCTGSPYIDELTVAGWALDADGMLAIPDAPGLGIELDPEAIERYSDLPTLLEQ